MRICVTAMERSLDAMVEPFFGRSRYFLIVDPGTMEFETIENPGANTSGGAGIKAAQAIADKGIDVLLTGEVGPNASSVLGSVGVHMMTGVSGTVREVVLRYKEGTTGTAQPVRGRGERVVSTGYGRGRRRYWPGRGYWCRFYPPPYYSPRPPPYWTPEPELVQEDEIAYLEDTLELLEEELQEVKERLRRLTR
jgi:predicted Fe-Mo cluster-binding NifX family protein